MDSLFGLLVLNERSERCCFEVGLRYEYSVDLLFFWRLRKCLGLCEKNWAYILGFALMLLTPYFNFLNTFPFEDPTAVELLEFLFLILFLHYFGTLIGFEWELIITGVKFAAVFVFCSDSRNVREISQSRYLICFLVKHIDL